MSAVLIAVIASGALTTLLVKLLDRRLDSDRAAGVRADTAASEVATLREVLAEVRQQDARKGQRLDALEDRIRTLEERERHQLTRAAVHEAWDQLAFQALVAQNPAHPPPPPLVLPEPPTHNPDQPWSP